MNPHSIAAKHRDPKPELRPSSSRTIPPEEGPIHVTSRQPLSPPGTSWGGCDSDQGPLSVLRSKQQRGRASCSRPTRLPAPSVPPRALSRVSAETRESSPQAREGMWPPSCGEDLDCARREPPGPPTVPRRPGVGSPALDPRPWGTPAQSLQPGASPSRRPEPRSSAKLSSLTAGFKGPSCLS